MIWCPFKVGTCPSAPLSERCWTHIWGRWGRVYTIHNTQNHTSTQLVLVCLYGGGYVCTYTHNLYNLWRRIPWPKDSPAADGDCGGSIDSYQLRNTCTCKCTKINIKTNNQIYSIKYTMALLIPMNSPIPMHWKRHYLQELISLWLYQFC